MDKMNILVAVIEGIVFLIPLFKVVWSLSHANDLIKQHETRLSRVEEKQEKYKEKIGDLLDNINKTLSSISSKLDMLDLRVSNLEKKGEN
jgi:peptidoglycan hydrolase CwlO-like protein